MQAAKIPSAHLPAGAFEREEQFWQWRQAISPYFESIPLIDPRDSEHPQTIRQFLVGNFIMIDSQFARQRFIRDAHWRRQHDDVDHIALQAYLTGRNMVANGNKDYVEDCGGIFAVNLGYEVNASATDADVVSVVLSRDWVASEIPGLLDACGCLFAPNSMAARLFTNFMVSLRQVLPVATVNDVATLNESLIGLLAALVRQNDATAADAHSGVFMALHQFVDAHLTDPDLGPTKLCQHFRLSRATLFRLFKEHGGVQAYIQRRRLIACFKALSTPQQMDRLIYDIALDYGFSSPSHFSTLFRQHFEMTPSEVRDQARVQYLRGLRAAHPDAANLSDVQLMQNWARALGGLETE